MCRGVILHANGCASLYETQQELASLVGVDGFVWDGRYISPSYASRNCLCLLDLAATAAAAGYDQSEVDESGDVDGVDFHWRRKES